MYVEFFFMQYSDGLRKQNYRPSKSVDTDITEILQRGTD